MDLSCIISSGDLELYVLGMLPEEEASKIEQLALLFPEVQQEIDLITESLAAVASASVPAAPSPSVKDNLMNKLKQLKSEEDQNATAGKGHTTTLYVEPETGKATQAPVIPISTGTPEKSRYPVWLAASVIALVVSISMLIYLSMVNNRNEEQIASLEQRADTLNKRFANEQQRNLAYAEMVKILQSDDYRKIDLVSVPGKPADAKAQVFWNKKTNEVYIADVSLPKAPAGKQYQLWGIVNGQPVDAGCMQRDARSLMQKMKNFTKAEMFAITLENEGCSPTPTLEQMYVAGKTS